MILGHDPDMNTVHGHVSKCATHPGTSLEHGKSGWPVGRRRQLLPPQAAAARGAEAAAKIPARVRAPMIASSFLD